jgi:hypothetical protein
VIFLTEIALAVELIFLPELVFAAVSFLTELARIALTFLTELALTVLIVATEQLAPLFCFVLEGAIELEERQDIFRSLAKKLAGAIQGNFFALLNKPSDALQNLDAFIGPVQTQCMINTIRICQNLEAASSDRLQVNI